MKTKITFSQPTELGIILHLEDEQFEIEGLEQLALSLVREIGKNIVMDEDFIINNDSKESLLVSTNRSTQITKDGITKTYSANKKDIAEALVESVKLNSLEYSSLSVAYKKASLSKDKYEEYLKRFKNKEKTLIKDTKILEDIISEEPKHHAKNEIEDFKKSLIAEWTKRYES